MSVGAMLVLGLVVTGTSSSWVPVSLLRRGITNEDTAKVLATDVEDNLIEATGCAKHKHACAGFGRGNCCSGMQCSGPGFGRCFDAPTCKATGSGCIGFGHGTCCGS